MSSELGSSGNSGCAGEYRGDVRPKFRHWAHYFGLNFLSVAFFTALFYVALRVLVSIFGFAESGYISGDSNVVDAAVSAMGWVSERGLGVALVSGALLAFVHNYVNWEMLGPQAIAGRQEGPRDGDTSEG